MERLDPEDAPGGASQKEVNFCNESFRIF